MYIENTFLATVRWRFSLSEKKEKRRWQGERWEWKSERGAEDWRISVKPAAAGRLLRDVKMMDGSVNEVFSRRIPCSGPSSQSQFFFSSSIKRPSPHISSLISCLFSFNNSSFVFYLSSQLQPFYAVMKWNWMEGKADEWWKEGNEAGKN